MMDRREMNRMLVLAAGAMLVPSGKAGAAEWPATRTLSGEAAQGSDPVSVDRLMTEPLAEMPDPEVRMLTLTVAPGAVSQAHRHTGPVFAYILEGSIENQVDPEPAKTYKPGDYFYEPPMHVHRQLKNSSTTEPAKILIVEVGEKGKPFTVGATGS